MNRDNKITIHDKKITNRDLFLSLGMALTVKNLSSIRTTDRLSFSKKFKKFGYVGSSEVLNLSLIHI